MATIYEVAKASGASPATVSRVFNGIGVSAQKTAAVREAAARLRFSPDGVGDGRWHEIDFKSR